MMDITNRARKVAVLGATGNLGSHVVRQLIDDGYRVSALVRNPNNRLPAEVMQTTGAIENIPLLDTFLSGHHALVYAVNPPYPAWKSQAMPLLETALKQAKKHDLLFVFPANVYNFNPQKTDTITNNTEMEAASEKGKIRIAMEQRIARYCSEGGRAVCIRAGDFIGKNTANTWFDAVVSTKANKAALTLPGEVNIPHTWAYLPDLAKEISLLIGTDVENGECRRVNYPGLEFTFEELKRAMEKALGIPVKTKQLPWTLLKFAGLFSPVLRELIEMRYLWQYRLRMEDDTLPEAEVTPLEGVLEAVLESSVTSPVLHQYASTK
ncbi:NAD(P)H-binding protein [Parasalinivibrio latis]